MNLSFSLIAMFQVVFIECLLCAKQLAGSLTEFHLELEICNLIVPEWKPELDERLTNGEKKKINQILLNSVTIGILF